jgi:hypothetical protein
MARQGVEERAGASSGRRPRGKEGLGTTWGTDAAVGRRGADDTGLEPASAGGRRAFA